MDGGIENPISFADTRDALIGMSGERTSWFTHTQFRGIGSLIKREREGYVDLHQEDALKRNISEGQLVKIYSPRGHIRMKVRISDSVHPGTARIAWGWGELDPEYSLNNLTDDSLRDPVTGTPSSRSFMCLIEP